MTPSVADPVCLSRIPDPTFFHPESRIRTASIPDPGSASKNLSILTPKKTKKWFLSSRKYDPGCLSRIPDPDADFYPSRIPDPGVKKALDPGSRIRIRNTGDPDERLKKGGKTKRKQSEKSGESIWIFTTNIMRKRKKNMK